MGRIGLIVLKTLPSDTVFSASVEGKDNICGEICHRRWMWNLIKRERERVCICLRVIWTGKTCSSSVGHSVSPSSLHYLRDREGKPWRFTTDNVRPLWSLQPAVDQQHLLFLLLFQVTAQGQEPGCPHTQGPPKFKICARYLHFLCPKVGHGPTCCSPNFQFSKDKRSWFSKTNITSHKGHATILPGSNTFFCMYSILNVFRKYYNWNASGLTWPVSSG